jgi:NADP-dependent 3-hydroxy acid dehydrogenase YdfG
MHDKVVIVSGAFGALGTAVAQTLGAAGARLVLVDAAASVPAALAREFQNHLLLPRVDLTRWEQVRAAVVQVVAVHAHVDALVNVAGAFRWERVGDGDPASWDELHAVNVKTALHARKAAASLISGPARRPGRGSVWELTPRPRLACCV